MFLATLTLCLLCTYSYPPFFSHFSSIVNQDIVLVGDTDEIPHPDAIHNLRAKVQYIHYRTQRGERIIPQIYKIFVDNYLYHFDCYVREIYAKGTPLTATILGDSKRLIEHYMDNIPIKRFLSASRLYLQHESPIRFDNVISPGKSYISPLSITTQLLH